jgi:hypothetical protein
MVAYHTAEMRLRFHVIVLVALVVVLTSSAALAQRRIVAVGAVQWTSSTRVQMMTDAGVSISIDVSRLGQTEYTSLRSGDRVSVIGVVAPDGTRLIAESIEPADPGGGLWNIFPQAS